MELPQDLPNYVSLIFIISAIFCLGTLFWAIQGSQTPKSSSIAVKVTLFLSVWLIFQMALTKIGVYNSGMNTMPPKIVLFGVIPTVFCMLYLFNNEKGKNFIDNLPLERIIIIHIVRIPIEFGLYYLFIENAIPKVMTFAGQNFDIIAGLTAPFVLLFGHVKRKLSNRFMLFWNIVCLALLVNIIVLAFLSAPSPFQYFGIQQPNIAIFNFPFSWLPTVIVPIVIFTHLVAIRQLAYQHEK